eukprot:1359421-Amorphochlora_amoeboformis.AAC.1
MVSRFAILSMGMRAVAGAAGVAGIASGGYIAFAKRSGWPTAPEGDYPDKTSITQHFLSPHPEGFHTHQSVSERAFDIDVCTRVFPVGRHVAQWEVEKRVFDSQLPEER